jgi:hypothetical protein
MHCSRGVVFDGSSTVVQSIGISHSMGRTTYIPWMKWKRVNSAIFLKTIRYAQCVDKIMWCELVLCLVIVYCSMVLRNLLMTSTWPLDCR